MFDTCASRHTSICRCLALLRLSDLTFFRSANVTGPSFFWAFRRTSASTNGLSKSKFGPLPQSSSFFLGAAAFGASGVAAGVGAGGGVGAALGAALFVVASGLGGSSQANESSARTAREQRSEGGVMAGDSIRRVKPLHSASEL